MKTKAYFVGHSHIDAVWLWDREETKEVLRHTFGKVLDLMDKDPDFYFTQSSAQFYKWMEEIDPSIFERIKRYIKEGRWEVTGGMWVEPDTNGISGESYARQIFYGKRYFKGKFGIDVKLAWLPDSFGYPNTLPMILKEGGISYFYSAKLNFEHPLHFPYYIFRWEAPNGEEVLAVHTFRYEGDPNDKAVKSAVGLATLMHPNYDRFMIVYGEGDHGGGISQQMVDHIRDVEREGIVETEIGRAIDYYRDLEKDRDLFPVWDDELYLKTHHGTYTTQGNFRRKNRYLEGLLYKTEVYATLSSLYGYTYPHEEIDHLWELLLFNQFHDALAGSSIPKVYEDAWKDFSEIEDSARKIKTEALNYLSNTIGKQNREDLITVFNPFNFPVSETLPYNSTYVYVEDVPPFGYKVVDLRRERKGEGDFRIKAYDGKIEMENAFLLITLSEETGHIESIYNKKIEREFLSAPGNIIQIYEDDDIVESAWNIHLGKRESLSEPESIKIAKDTPLIKEVEIEYRYKQEGNPESKIKIYITLFAHFPYVKVELKMNLHTQKRTYKVAFPLNTDTEYTFYETPYGYIKRIDPISPGADSVERYKQEVPGGKWVWRDGFTLINDGRFGFDVQDGKTLRMTIARTVRYPKPIIMALDGYTEDVYTDQGDMELSYLIYPHGGDWRQNGVCKLAWQFNVGLDILPFGMGEGEERGSSLFDFSEDVIVTALKRKREGEGIVVRFFEQRGASPLIRGDFVKSNIMEEELNRIRDFRVNSYSLHTLIKKAP